MENSVCTIMGQGSKHCLFVVGGGGESTLCCFLAAHCNCTSKELKIQETSDPKAKKRLASESGVGSENVKSCDCHNTQHRDSIDP